MESFFAHIMGSCCGNTSDSSNERKRRDVKEKHQKQQNQSQPKDDKIELSLECALGQLLQSLPMKGTIQYEKENTFWFIKLSNKWQENELKFAELTDKLFENEEWYKDGIERGKQWANLVNETDINIQTVPTTSITGLHITLARMDINDEKKPDCFVNGNTVKFKAKRLICHPPFRAKPKNLPGQKMEDNGYRYYATHWMSLEIEFVDFEYKTTFSPHISLCNIAVKLKADHVQNLDDSK